MPSFDEFADKMSLILGGLAGLQIDPALYAPGVIILGKHLIKVEALSREQTRHHKSIEDTTFDSFDKAINEAHVRLSRIESTCASIRAECEHAQENVRVSADCIQEMERALAQYKENH